MKAKAKEITPQELAEIIRRHPRVVALTGAGISVESGIPDFRSPGGLWERFDPMEYAHIQAFRRHPAKVWQLLKEMDDDHHPGPAQSGPLRPGGAGGQRVSDRHHHPERGQPAPGRGVQTGGGVPRQRPALRLRYLPRPPPPGDPGFFPYPALLPLRRPDPARRGLLRGGHSPRGPGRGRRTGPALRPAPGHRHLGRSGPGQLHPPHRQGMARPHRGKQPGTHPPHHSLTDHFLKGSAGKLLPEVIKDL